jgi:excinuclease UvrABC helicase subunit UvrB
MANVIARTGWLPALAPKDAAAQLYSIPRVLPDPRRRGFVSYYDYYQPEAYSVGGPLHREVPRSKAH